MTIEVIDNEHRARWAEAAAPYNGDMHKVPRHVRDALQERNRQDHIAHIEDERARFHRAESEAKRQQRAEELAAYAQQKPLAVGTPEQVEQAIAQATGHRGPAKW